MLFCRRVAAKLGDSASSGPCAAGMMSGLPVAPIRVARGRVRPCGVERGCCGLSVWGGVLLRGAPRFAFLCVLLQYLITL
jgi:hypothetical protein